MCQVVSTCYQLPSLPHRCSNPAPKPITQLQQSSRVQATSALHSRIVRCLPGQSITHQQRTSSPSHTSTCTCVRVHVHVHACVQIIQPRMQSPNTSLTVQHITLWLISVARSSCMCAMPAAQHCTHFRHNQHKSMDMATHQHGHDRANRSGHIHPPWPCPTVLLPDTARTAPTCQRAPLPTQSCNRWWPLAAAAGYSQFLCL
jgi:hypothetical protein